jgi:methylated-DNA-[protein]-cysteine S-methyltransferase
MARFPSPNGAAAYGFALFDTAIGRCGIAWGPAGVIATRLPEGDEIDTRESLARRLPAAREIAPPPAIEEAIDAVTALLRGEDRDLSAITLDMDAVPDFHARVYRVARTIPRGATLSYGEVAARAGAPQGARAVGQALGRNPFAIIVPCHRVLAAGGKIGGFSAHGGLATKRRLLALEMGAAFAAS